MIVLKAIIVVKIVTCMHYRSEEALTCYVCRLMKLANICYQYIHCDP